jgi:large subunit ribosomal protein L4
MKLTIKDLSGQARGELDIQFDIIQNGKGTQAVHDTVVAYQAAQRSGTAATKARGEVAGSAKNRGGRKAPAAPAPVRAARPCGEAVGWFLAPTRDFSKKVNTKTKQLALRKALSERLKAGDVIVVEDLTLAAPKTRNIVNILRALEIDGTALFVSAAADKNLLLATRNLREVTLTTSDLLNTYDVLRPDKLVFTRGALEKVEARLAKN